MTQLNPVPLTASDVHLLGCVADAFRMVSWGGATMLRLGSPRGHMDIDAEEYLDDLAARLSAHLPTSERNRL